MAYNGFKKTYSNKNKDIEKFQKNKTESIKRFMDAKEISIMISQAVTDALEMSRILVDKGELKVAERLVWAEQELLGTGLWIRNMRQRMEEAINAEQTKELDRFDQEYQSAENDLGGEETPLVGEGEQLGDL